MVLNMVQSEILHNELLVIHAVYRIAHQMHSNIGYTVLRILVAKTERRLICIFIFVYAFKRTSCPLEIQND